MDDTSIESATRADGIQLYWHDGIELVPGKRAIRAQKKLAHPCFLEEWSFVMAHEFFDALPIHSFEVGGILLSYCHTGLNMFA